MNLSFALDALLLDTQKKVAAGTITQTGTASGGEVYYKISHGSTTYTYYMPFGSALPYFGFDDVFGNDTRVQLLPQPSGEPLIDVAQGDRRTLQKRVVKWLEENFSPEALPFEFLIELAELRLDKEVPSTKREANAHQRRAESLRNHRFNVEDAMAGLRTCIEGFWRA